MMRKEIHLYIYEGGFEQKIEKITDFEPSGVLRLTVRDAR
jgi:hypothetical protein